MRRPTLYIVSKGRHDSRLTVQALDRMGVDFKIVVEEQEYPLYAAVIDPGHILVLDTEYQKTYDTFDDLGDAKSKGPGPARNFVLEHSISAGDKWHWVMDDNIRHFYRLNHNLKAHARGRAIFNAMEDFVCRYTNVLMAGPNYEMFTPRKYKSPVFVLNTRIYSCNLIRNDMPFRWRGRYNEDTDLSIRMLKQGWVTVLFNAFLQDKVMTQNMKGGNTREFYDKEGTIPKSAMLARMHPDVTKIVTRFGRCHHHVNYKTFSGNTLIRKKDCVTVDRVNNYGMKLRQVG